MSDKNYFVMLNHPNGGFVPLMENDEDMSTFETDQDARNGADGTCIGPIFGYEVFQMGTGD